MIHSLNLVKSIPNREIRRWVTNWLYGIVPADGVTRSLQTILENQDRYAKYAEEVDKRNLARKHVK